MQQATKKGGIETDIADPAELQGRILSDQFTAFPVFICISFACLRLVVGSLGQPHQHLRMFVGGVVVQHHINLQIWRYGSIDLLEKFQLLPVPVARLDWEMMAPSRMLSAANNVDVRFVCGRGHGFMHVRTRVASPAV